ncbi:MAG: STAS domain-containing protein [Anaerolineae bacterium]
MPVKTVEADTSTTLSTSVRHEPGVAIIDLSGEIDAFAEGALNAAYTEAASRDSTAILLNFSEVDYINSTGIALIVSLLAQARKAHRRLLTCGLSDHYLEIFQITRLADFMDIFADEASALADASSS